MAKYIKLGKKARGGSFYEPNTKVAASGGKVSKVTEQALKHPRVAKAISAGHLVMATEAEYDKWMAANKVAAENAKASEAATESKESKADTGKDVAKMNKAELVEYALSLDGIQYDEAELEDMNKAEIKAEIEELLEESEEEEDDDDDSDED